MPPYIKILGTRINIVDKKELEAIIIRAVKQHKHTLIFNVNLQCLNLCYEQPALRSIMNQNDIVFCDGAGVRLAARLKGHRLPPRITYADWIWELATFCEREDISLYFLGGRPGVAARASNVILSRFPKLQIKGTHHGYFDKGVKSRENRGVIEAINHTRADILIAGLGMPLQEYWLKENWEQLDVHVALSGGAIFDYIAGDLKRAPRWMTQNGLEWLGRLIIEPRRLWRRYLIGLPLFFWRFSKEFWQEIN